MNEEQFENHVASASTSASTNGRSSTTIVLPVPPSTNGLFKNIRRGRAKTENYQDWIAAADDCLIQQKRGLKRFTGRCALDIRLPDNIKGDISNRIKAVEDFLVSREITGDDRLNDRVSIERDHTVVDCCVVTITEAA